MWIRARSSHYCSSEQDVKTSRSLRSAAFSLNKSILITRGSPSPAPYRLEKRVTRVKLPRDDAGIRTATAATQLQPLRRAQSGIERIGIDAGKANRVKTSALKSRTLRC